LTGAYHPAFPHWWFCGKFRASFLPVAVYTRIRTAIHTWQEAQAAGRAVFEMTRRDAKASAEVETLTTAAFQ